MSSVTRLFAAGLLLVGLTPVMPAFSIGGFQFLVTNEFITQYNGIANEHFQYYELFSLTATVKNWELGVTLRGFNFYQQTPNTTLDGLNTDLYRFHVRHTGKRWNVSAGDFYALLGRGLVLSVLKNEDVMRERTITGGVAAFHLGPVDARILGGVVRDETEDQKWILAGGEAALEWIRGNRLALHFSYINDLDSRLQLGPRITYSLSLRGNRLLKHFSYYAEVARLDFLDSGSLANDGYGLYASLTFNRAPWTFLAEYRNYSDFNNEMNNPPVADLEDEISPVADTDGFRFQAQYALFSPDLRLVFNHGRYREYGDRGGHTAGGVIVEDLWDRLDVSISYGIRDILFPIRKFKCNALVRLSDRWSIELHLSDKRYRDGEFFFNEQDHSLQISAAPFLSLHILHQYSHNRIQDLNHFYSGGVKVFLKEGTVIELSAGTLRGGQLCSGGQCFVIPPFKGVRLSVLFIFK